jgi:GDP-L-fucose synthase
MSGDARVFVAGHRGLVGSAIVRRLATDGVSALTRTHAELDLTDAVAVRSFFESARPTHVYLAAAKVGGILANATYPADFLRENLLIQAHVIDAALHSGVQKLLFLGSSCIYPRMAPQPMREDALMTGPLEATNTAYAIAKIAGVELVRAYRQQHGMSAISLMPTNLYGPFDNFDLNSSHVLPALIRKFEEARRTGAAAVTIWGTGTPRREFLYVDDLADAAVFLMRNYDDGDPINVGVGDDITIAGLARLVARSVGFEGTLEFDTSKPDGTPRKLLDVSKLNALGWRATTSLEEGLTATLRWYREQG